MKRFLVLSGFLSLCSVAQPLSAQGSGACDAESYHRLDFWVGEWVVTVGGQQAGTNRIERVLNGCAVTESWRGADGSEGRSLFYYLPASDEWRQVWVTGAASRTGGVKEKREVARPDGGIRFQGTIARTDGGSYLDRTTLTPNADGSVRQLIEISTDNGGSWRPVFDGLYRRR